MLDRLYSPKQTADCRRHPCIEGKAVTKTPKVTCYLCRRTFEKRIEGAAHNRNYYRCQECLNEQAQLDEIVRLRAELQFTSNELHRLRALKDKP